MCGNQIFKLYRSINISADTRKFIKKDSHQNQTRKSDGMNMKSNKNKRKLKKLLKHKQMQKKRKKRKNRKQKKKRRIHLKDRLLVAGEEIHFLRNHKRSRSRLRNHRHHPRKSLKILSKWKRLVLITVTQPINTTGVKILPRSLCKFRYPKAPLQSN